jgi:D-psicose/D-tagatose/L-ribulose 3-epimerase
VNRAVSTIAWPRDQDAAIADVLCRHGIAGIEIAPTKFWPNPLEATGAEIDDYRHSWDARGIRIVAAQALLFGKPELTLFESSETRQCTLDYLARIVRLCARLGAGTLVFGSPRNRRIGRMPRVEAYSIAVDFFSRLAETAAREGTCIALEANPPEYGADFVTNAAEAIELVETVNHPGLRLHLDTGCMTLAGDSIRSTFDRGFAPMKHFHVSEPNLDPPTDSGTVDHKSFAEELRRRDYRGWVSLEMREPKPFIMEEFAKSLTWFHERY